MVQTEPAHLVNVVAIRSGAALKAETSENPKPTVRGGEPW